MCDNFKHETTGLTLQARAAAMVRATPCSAAPVNPLDTNLPWWGEVQKKFPAHPLHLNKHGFQIWETLAAADFESHR